jgi:hypothetical protein
LGFEPKFILKDAIKAYIPEILSMHGVSKSWFFLKKTIQKS